MKKITILMLHLNFGGIERQTITMANNLCDKYDIEIVSVYNFNNNIAYNINSKIKIKYLLDYGSNKAEVIESLKNRKLFKLLKELCFSAKVLINKKKVLKTFIKNIKTDILFSTRIEFANYISKYYNGEGRTLTQEHNHFGGEEKYGKYFKKATGKIDYIIVMTDYAKKIYCKYVDEGKIKVIPNIIEKIPKKQSKLDNNMILSIGRLEEIKQVDQAIKGFYEANKLNKDLKLKIIGEGLEKEQLKKLVKELKLEENVFFTGLQNDIELTESLQKADTILITSKSECFPMVILEANSFGIPVISYDIPSGPTSMISSENGILTEKYNTGKLGQSIIDYYKMDREKKIVMGNKAVEYAKKHVPDQIIPIWESIFEKDKKMEENINEDK